LGSLLADRASGVLLAELEAMGSLLADCARATAVPAGGALAVDRDAFSRRVTQHIQEHPGIEVIREEVAVAAGADGGSGPLLPASARIGA
jgi:methylenetetrahydrofolate--tRNA-(uracil-5-)-methyltransferase